MTTLVQPHITYTPEPLSRRRPTTRCRAYSEAVGYCEWVPYTDWVALNVMLAQAERQNRAEMASAHSRFFVAASAAGLFASIIAVHVLLWACGWVQ